MEMLQVLLHPKYLGARYSRHYRCAIDAAVTGGHLKIVQDLISEASTAGFEISATYYY